MHARTLITVADDFGLTETVNEACEQAAAEGILTSASLMVAAPAAADAVARARRLNGKLAVGLHLVLVEGAAMLPAAEIPALIGPDGWFSSDQARLGVRYAFSAAARRQLAAEIRAQFAAFAATGLKLDHLNAHKHMHLHPVVAALALRIGREFGLRAVRVPTEAGPATSLGDRALRQWTRLLRAQARAHGMLCNDHVLGLHHSGHMTPALVQRLVDTLPPGLTELYFHPATASGPLLRRYMPEYEHRAEFEALLRTTIPPGVRLATYSSLPARDSRT